jgi:hypothetical protein
MEKYLQGWKRTEITYRTDGDDKLNHPFSHGEDRSAGREWCLRILKYVCLHMKCYSSSEYSSAHVVYGNLICCSPASTLLSTEDSLSTSRTISMCRRFGDTEPSCNKANARTARINSQFQGELHCPKNLVH